MMKRYWIAVFVTVAYAAAGIARGTTLVPPVQRYVFELQTGIAQFPASPLLDLSPQYTIEFWVMHENNSSSPFFGKAIPNSSALAYGFGFDSSGGINYGQSTGVASTYVQVTSSSVLPLHTWTHVAATSDGANITLCVNGAQAAQVASPGTPQNITSIPLQLGMGTDYIFAVRQLRFWNVTLTPQQLAVLATSRLSGNEPGLVADWPFEDGTVGVTHDIGPNHLDLPLPGVGDYSPPHPYMRWIHTAVLDAGPFFSTEGPFPATSLNGTQFFLTASAVLHLGSPGVADIVTLAESSDPNVPGPLVVLRNDGSGHFSDQSAATFGGAGPTAFGARRLVVADFDGDGRDDLFIPVIGEGRTPNWGGQNHLLLQTVAGQLTDVTETNLPQVNTYSYFARAGDIDGSGRKISMSQMSTSVKCCLLWDLSSSTTMVRDTLRWI